MTTSYRPGPVRSARTSGSLFLTGAALFCLSSACLTADESSPANPENENPVKESTESPAPAETPEKNADATEPSIATLGGGCFWCIEAVMERLEGVIDVKSGYMGGHVEHPTYEQVCRKDTGHVEVVQVVFQPDVIGYEELLDVFWQAHDPTTRDRQGPDVGPQYRSAIFYHSADQKEIAERSKTALDASKKYDRPAVTEIAQASQFWIAEDYHQDFYRNNPAFGYCRVVIHPKLKKLGILKEDE